MIQGACATMCGECNWPLENQTSYGKFIPIIKEAEESLKKMTGEDLEIFVSFLHGKILEKQLEISMEKNES